MAYILIVDDDREFADPAALVLRHAGHEVSMELTVDDGLASMNLRLPDLLILDVMFPENTSAGFELAREMRHDHAKLKNVPILMLTAVNERFPLGLSDRDIDKEWLPVSSFLEKPVDLKRLIQEVETLLAKDGKSGNQTSR